MGKHVRKEKQASSEFHDGDDDEDDQSNPKPPKRNPLDPQPQGLRHAQEGRHVRAGFRRLFCHHLTRRLLQVTFELWMGFGV